MTLMRGRVGTDIAIAKWCKGWCNDDVIGLVFYCMAETDNNPYSGSKRVNIKILGGVPSFQENLSRYQVSHLLVVQLLSYVSSRRRRKTTWTK